MKYGKLSINLQGTSNSAENTFNDILKFIYKILLTYFHLIVRPDKIAAYIVLKNNEASVNKEYIIPYNLSIVSIFLSTGVIKARVYDRLNDINIGSIEAYDRFLKDYSLFSNIIYVLVIFFILSFLARILLFLFEIIIIPCIEKLMIVVSQNNRSFRVIDSAKGDVKTIGDLQYYYASLYLLFLSIGSINSKDLRDKVFNPSIFLVIEFVISIAVIFFFFKAKFELNKNILVYESLTKEILIEKIKEIYQKIKGRFILIFREKIFPKILCLNDLIIICLPFKIMPWLLFLISVSVVWREISSLISKVKLYLAFFFENLFKIKQKACISYYFKASLIYFLIGGIYVSVMASAIHFINPISKDIAASVLQITGQDQYVPPVEIYGPVKSDSLTISIRKNKNDEYYLETNVCLKNNQAIEMTLKKAEVIQLFRDPSKLDVMNFFDTSYDASLNEDFIKLEPGAYRCFILRADIDWLIIHIFRQKVNREIVDGSLIKPLLVPNDNKIDNHYQKMKIGLIN